MNDFKEYTFFVIQLTCKYILIAVRRLLLLDNLTVNA
jgi:hypothetical protein